MSTGEGVLTRLHIFTRFFVREDSVGRPPIPFNAGVKHDSVAVSMASAPSFDGPDDLGGILISSLTAAALGNQVHAFGVGTDGAMFHTQVAAR